MWPEQVLVQFLKTSWFGSVGIARCHCFTLLISCHWHVPSFDRKYLAYTRTRPLVLLRRYSFRNLGRSCGLAIMRITIQNKVVGRIYRYNSIVVLWTKWCQALLCCLLLLYFEVLHWNIGARHRQLPSRKIKSLSLRSFWACEQSRASTSALAIMIRPTYQIESWRCMGNVSRFILLWWIPSYRDYLHSARTQDKRYNTCCLLQISDENSTIMLLRCLYAT